MPKNDPRIPPPGEFRSGFVAILGKPNAGKSTLVNSLVGEKLAAVSGLPNTTRDRLHAILTTETMQAIFVDLPGLVLGTDRLNESLRRRVLDGIAGVDVVLHLIDVEDKEPITADVAGVLASISTPVILAVNKIDCKSAAFDARSWAGELPAPFNASLYRNIIGVSALHRTGLDELVARIEQLLPIGVHLYDPEQLTDRNLRFLSAELIREKVFHFTHEEIPYSAAVEIEEFHEQHEGKTFVAAIIHVERDSQKGIVIGHGGAMLKKISTAARKDIEHLLDGPVFLQLHVKVSRDWRRSERALREFGYLE
jgi:GTP-binding protein Era